MKIADFALSGLKIEQIIIPPSVTKICNHAFSQCINLRRVDIPPDSNLQTIENHVFENTPITCFYIPPSVKFIERKGFRKSNILIIEIDENCIWKPSEEHFSKCKKVSIFSQRKHLKFFS